MAVNQDLADLFADLDADTRELLSLIHIIKIKKMTREDGKHELQRALFLSQKIAAELYELRDSE